MTYIVKQFFFPPACSVRDKKKFEAGELRFRPGILEGSFLSYPGAQGLRENYLIWVLVQVTPQDVVGLNMSLVVLLLFMVMPCSVSLRGPKTSRWVALWVPVFIKDKMWSVLRSRQMVHPLAKFLKYYHWQLNCDEEFEVNFLENSWESNVLFWWSINQ